MKPARKINSSVRILLSVALIGLTLYLVEKKKPTARDHGATPGRPLLTDLPSPEGSSRFAWLPSYPGAQLEDIRRVTKRDQIDYSYDFLVKDDGFKVREFYESKLKGAGFTVIGKGGANGNSWDLYAENPDRTRSVDVNGNAQPEGVKVGVAAVVRE